MYMEEETDKINWKHSTAHAPSPGNKRTDKCWSCHLSQYEEILWQYNDTLWGEESTTEDRHY